MKLLLFLCSPNSIGKTTIAGGNPEEVSHSAYVDSDACRKINPFVLNDDTIPTIARTISSLLLSYLECPPVETVLFLHTAFTAGAGSAYPGRISPFSGLLSFSALAFVVQ